jgi:hypothetical protein
MNYNPISKFHNTVLQLNSPMLLPEITTYKVEDYTNRTEASAFSLAPLCLPLTYTTNLTKTKLPFTSNFKILAPFPITPWGWILQKSTDSLLLNEISSISRNLSLQGPAPGPYPEPDKSIPHPLSIPLLLTYNLILSISI